MKHESIEINAGLLIVLTLVAVSIGGLVEIVPLFHIKDTVEEVKGVRPYTPLELRGRDLYIREGCYACHSQMIRPFRDEMLRYGHYSLAAESKYDHPFQWASKRTGPDIARLGGKYSDEWHTQHLIRPQNVVPESIMPAYPWLMEKELSYGDIENRMKALKMTGVPYSLTEEEYQANVAEHGKEMADKLHIPNAKATLEAEANGRNWDGDKSRITEMDAMVAYLQMLGTLVDFKQYEQGYFANFR
ncbi:MAG: cytochrome-c oxidase, cbb3-type subunit II [Pseudomonadota bacterium]